MKFSREQLRALVKDILVEILNEGLGTLSQQSPLDTRITGVAESRSTRRQQSHKQNFDPRLDTPLSNEKQLTENFKKTVKAVSGGSQIMESIFADTAQTTLQQQIAHGDSSPTPSNSTAGKPVQQEQFAGRPEDVFAGSANKWAALAFAGSDKK